MIITLNRMRTLDNLKNKIDMVIIPCSSTKLPYSAPAKDFYCGKGYFLHQKRLAEVLGKPWLILSTKYGLIAPTFECQPYNLIWSKKVQQDNKSMRGKEIPVATEERRLHIAHQVKTQTEGLKVLSFCSLHYKPYMPDLLYFNEIVKPFAPNGQNGIQFLVKTMNQWYLELLNEV